MKKQGFRGGVPPPGPHVLYMRARRRRRCPHARARETRSKTHHGPPVAPPARAWCVLSRVSPALPRAGAFSPPRKVRVQGPPAQPKSRQKLGSSDEPSFLCFPRRPVGLERGYSRELTVPSKRCNAQEKIHSDFLPCSIFATTPAFGKEIFFVQK